MLPDDTLTIEELAERAHVSPRLIRYYLTEGLLERPPKRGRELRFDREQVARLQAIRELQRQGLSLEAIQRQLDRMPPREWQVFTRPGHAPPVTRLLMAQPAAGSAGRALGEVRERLSSFFGSRRAEEREVWVRVRVTPEVEIQYRAEGGARIQEAMREIAEFARRRLADTPPPRAET
jgi:DNA-binding transcriptional MerR regulator